MARGIFLAEKGKNENNTSYYSKRLTFNIRPYTVNFITPEGEKITVKAVEGDTMLDLAQRYDIDLECMQKRWEREKEKTHGNIKLGACEGSLACSTCHVIVDPEYYDKMEEPSDEENDMLDLAFGLTETYVIILRQ